MKKLQGVMLAGALIGLLVFVWYGFRMYRNRMLTEAMMAEQNQTAGYQISAAMSKDAAYSTPEPKETRKTSSEIFREESVEWNGVSYRRNTYVKAILCIGVDRNDSMTEYRGFDEAGQADVIFLIAQDTARNTLKVLMIPRDTMAEIGIVNPDMSSAGTMVRQLALAYANGDGRESSCGNTVEAVEKLLHGFQIDHYLAADAGIISLLNDAVGGVTVTVPTEGMEKKDPAFVKGETITLHGKQAEAFVRYRDIHSAYSAIYRMDQQKEYMKGFFGALKAASKKNSQIVPQLFELIRDYMITDMGKELYLKLSVDALNEGSLEQDDFYILPGSGIMTEVYEEYYADDNGMTQILLDLFYRESSMK